MSRWRSEDWAVFAAGVGVMAAVAAAAVALAAFLADVNVFDLFR